MGNWIEHIIQNDRVGLSSGIFYLSSPIDITLTRIVTTRSRNDVKALE